jgi:hypothetical protein
MKSMGPIRGLFLVGGLYDGVLGAAFLLAGPEIFRRFGVTPPNHFGYVQFPALLLIVFAAMFFAVAARPQANRNLIPYGILLKLSYCGTVIYHWLNGGIPGMWKPFVAADLVFAVLFFWAYAVVQPTTRDEAH